MLRSRGFWISTASTVVFLVVIAVLLLTAPGIHNLHEGLFSVHDMRAALPSVWDGFKINLKMMAIAEVLVLICALGVAILRGLPGPAAFPLRVVAIVYTDVFRGLPTILVAIFIGPRLPVAGPVGGSRHQLAVHVRGGDADPRLLGLCRGGLPGGDRVGATRARRGGPLARA